MDKMYIDANTACFVDSYYRRPECDIAVTKVY